MPQTFKWNQRHNCNYVNDSDADYDAALWVCVCVCVKTMWGQDKVAGLIPNYSRHFDSVLPVFWGHLEVRCHYFISVLISSIQGKNAGETTVSVRFVALTHPRWTVRMCRWIPEEVLRTFSQFFHKHLNITFMEFCKRRQQGMIDDVPEGLFPPPAISLELSSVGPVWEMKWRPARGWTLQLIRSC